MGFVGIVLMLAGLATSCGPVFVMGVALFMIHIDRLRQKDKEEN
jgi:hypothetical protein